MTNATAWLVRGAVTVGLSVSLAACAEVEAWIGLGGLDECEPTVTTITETCEPTTTESTEGTPTEKVVPVVPEDMSPAFGLPHDLVVISGSGLRGAEVRLGSEVVPLVTDTDRSISFAVPDRAPGPYTVTVDGVDVGDFGVLSEVTACPRDVAAGEPVELALEGADEVTQVSFHDANTGAQLASVPRSQFDAIGHATIAMHAPESLAVGAVRIVVERAGTPLGTQRDVMGVLAEAPFGPPSPSSIRYPDLTRTDFIPPIANAKNPETAGTEGRDWWYGFDFLAHGDSFLMKSSEHQCGEVGRSGVVVVTESYSPPDGASVYHRGAGAYNLDDNWIEFTMMRTVMDPASGDVSYEDETYRGMFGDLDPELPLQNYGGYTMYLRSLETCRQLVVPVNYACDL